MRIDNRIRRKICACLVMMLFCTSSSTIVLGTETIAVTDIEIGSHEDELNVGESLTLSANVLPADATNSTVTYKSSNTSIATVSSTGEVRGISKGKVVIYITADNVTKEVPLTVKVATTGIKLNKDYLVLKAGSTFQLSAKVTPAAANQSITYRSIDESIATVSKKGLVTAGEIGNTTIVISNGDTTVAVSVIVNQQTVDEKEDGKAEETIEDVKSYTDSVKASEVAKVDSDTLYHLYETGKSLEIVGDGYTIELDGKSIVNYKNEFYTDINMVQDEDGTSFNLNQGDFLCGDVRIYLQEPAGKYLYLYNTSKEKYELIQTDNLKELELTTAGLYRITDEKLSYSSITIVYVIAIGVVAILIGVGVYIAVKKRYWFW